MAHIIITERQLSITFPCEVLGDLAEVIDPAKLQKSTLTLLCSAAFRPILRIKM